MVGGEGLPEILGQTDPVRANTPIFIRYLLVVPQPKERRKCATKYLFVKPVSDKVVRHLLAYLFVQKWFTELQRTSPAT